MKRILSLVLVLACLLCCVPVTQAQAAETFRYNPTAAVQYAKAHWADNDGTVCDQFVKACLKAGGITIEAGDVDPVLNALVDAGYGEHAPIKLAANGRSITQKDNPKLKAGDILFYRCSICDKNVHTVIISGFDTSGNATYYGHNPAAGNEAWFGVYKHTAKNGELHQNCISFSAVHMDTSVKDHKHDFQKTNSSGANYFDAAHPHAMYVKCSCGAKYYLGWNAKVSACTSCNPPKGSAPVVEANAVAGADGKVSISLTWSTVQGAESYKLYRATAYNGTYYEIGDVYAVNTNNASVESGQTYYYRVDAIKADGKAVPSEIISIKATPGEVSETAEPVVVGKPVVTAKVVTTNGKNEVSLSWNVVDNAIDYTIWRSSSLTGTYFKLNTITGTKFGNSSVEDGKTYYYRVDVKKNDGYTVSSDVVSITIKTGATSQVAKPASPKPVTVAAPKLKAFTAKSATGFPKLQWSEVKNAAKYELRRAPKGSNIYTTLDTISATDDSTYTYTDGTAQAGQTYNYVLYAVASDGTTSKVSNTKAVTCYPSKPILDSHIIANGKPYITWTGSNGATGYIVYKKGPTDKAFVKLIQKPGTNVMHTGATAGKTYQYYVMAYVKNSDGTTQYSLKSDVISITAKTMKPDLEGTTVNGKPRMTWESLPGVDGYLVYVREKGTPTFKKLIQTTKTSVTHTGAHSGTIYQYYVKAFTKVDGKFVYGTPSDIISIKSK